MTHERLGTPFLACPQSFEMLDRLAELDPENRLWQSYVALVTNTSCVTSKREVSRASTCMMQTCVRPRSGFPTLAVLT
jgi:hypothetical protein